MEELCVGYAPRLALKGQGCRVLVTAVLWMLASCRPSCQTAVHSPTPPLQAGYSAGGVLTSRTARAAFPADVTTASPALSPSSPLHSPTSPGTGRLQGSASPALLSSFPASSARAGQDVNRPALGSATSTTTFLDSVAASLRWNPTEGEGEKALGDTRNSSVQAVMGASALLLLGGSASAPGGVTDGAFVWVASTPAWTVPGGLASSHSLPSLPSLSELPLEPSPLPDLSGALSAGLTSGTGLSTGTHLFPGTDLFSGTPLYTGTDLTTGTHLWAGSAMFDTSSVQPSASLLLSAGESSTASSTPPPLNVSSLGPAQGNTSCGEKEAGCVEYRGEGEGGEEEARVKVIVGVACAAVLVLIIVGLIVAYMLRRRGKMTSGSKVNLSSYWDDNVTLSYINGQIEIPKDSADEMISLDNDSFLNSLDSMSFTNTWTSDTSNSKHTNF